MAAIEPVKVEPCLWRRQKQQAALAQGNTDCSNNPRRGTEAAEADAGHVKGAADQHLRMSSVLRRRFRCPRLRPSVVYGHDSLGDRRVRVGRQRFTEHLQKGSSGARWHMPDWIASPHRPGAALPAANQRPRVCRFIARACARAQYVPRPRRLANTPQVQPSGLNPLQPLQQQRRRKQHASGNSVTGGGEAQQPVPALPTLRYAPSA